MRDINWKKKNVLSKIKFFISSGKDKLHLILDFDRVLTKDVATWEILKSGLPQKAQEECQQLYNIYRPLEIKNRMTTLDATNWWGGTLNIFQENRLKLSDIKKDVDTKLPIRPFVKELFKICERKNIPIIILSAGIKDIIELWCQKFKINPTLILSTKLIFSSKGRMTGWEKDSLIHILNKKEKGQREIRKIKSTRPNTILIGDSLDDADAVQGEADVLRIAVYDPRQDERINNLKEFTKRFDIVIRDGTLRQATEILNSF